MAASIPSRRAGTLRQSLEKLGIRPKQAAALAGVPYSTIMNFLNGNSQSMRGETEAKLARALGRSVSELFEDEPAIGSPQSMAEMPETKIVGTVEAGAWREAVSLDEDLGLIKFIPHPAFRADVQFAMRISGPSCNRVVQDGGLAIVVPYDQIPGGVDALAMRTDPPLVVFERQRGSAYEYTIKALHRNGTGFELHPVSDHKDHQAIIPLNEKGDTDEVRIAFVVVQVINSVF
jgi:transcriptional regulator with XRE-family HTH domain